MIQYGHDPSGDAGKWDLLRPIERGHMQRILIFDFADLPQNSTERQVIATEQLGVLCGLNRRTCRRLAKTVFHVLSNYPPDDLLENEIGLVANDHGWSLEFRFVTHPHALSEVRQPMTGNLGSLRRAGEKLADFEMTGSPADGFEIRFAESLAVGFEVPRSRELRQWERIVSKGDWQEAFGRLSRIYFSSKSKIQHLRDGVAIQRDVLGLDKKQADMILSLVASKTDNPVMIFDKSGKVEWINRAFYQLTGFELQEGKTAKASSLIFADQPNREAADLFAASLEAGHGFSVEYSWSPGSRKLQGIYQADNQQIWIEFQVTPVLDEQESISRWIAIGADITQRRQAELAMKAAKELAESANRAKSDFLAMMSHEIRTPMNAIIGMTELTLATELSQEQREYLSTANISAQALLHILNDILDLSKAEAHRLELDRTDFNLADLTKDTLESLTILAQKKSLSLICNFSNEIPQQLIGDPNRLRQVLVNLVGNAIKFTRTGGVVVDVELTDELIDRATIHFQVRDTGVGIAEDQISRIFEAFYQTDVLETRNFGGTGLGLAITTELVRLMGGRIWVESKLGKGSTFHFVLSLPKSTLAVVPKTLLAAQSAIARTDSPLNVLIVDDHAVNRSLISAVLQRRGHVWQQACSGKQAIEMIQEFDFDVVLMDVQMPEQNGFETTATVRGLDGSKSRIPIVAVTAYGTDEDRQRCLHAGMDDYLPKPISIAALLEKVERWGLNDRECLRSTRNTSSHENQSLIQDAPNWASPIALNILVAADDPILTHECRNENVNGAHPAFDAALQRLDGDVELLKLQMGFFVEETPELLGKIRMAIQDYDAKALHHFAHRLKGLVSCYDSPRCTELTAKLESMGREEDLADADSTLAMLVDLVEVLRDRIAAYQSAQ